MSEERARKIDKIIQQLRQQLINEGAMDENFFGKLAFRFHIKSGGIVGTVGIEKDGKVVSA